KGTGQRSRASRGTPGIPPPPVGAGINIETPCPRLALRPLGGLHFTRGYARRSFGASLRIAILLASEPPQ
ncbi:MAG TPA: hypothetical protein P5081_17395, partial [Phycisphaerae bacterium]|nr:hypothetical protein [Phycisphaerae bacterium]